MDTRQVASVLLNPTPVDSSAPTDEALVLEMPYGGQVCSIVTPRHWLPWHPPCLVILPACLPGLPACLYRPCLDRAPAPWLKTTCGSACCSPRPSTTTTRARDREGATLIVQLFPHTFLPKKVVTGADGAPKSRPRGALKVADYLWFSAPPAARSRFLFPTSSSSSPSSSSSSSSSLRSDADGKGTMIGVEVRHVGVGSVRLGGASVNPHVRGVAGRCGALRGVAGRCGALRGVAGRFPHAPAGCWQV